MGESFRHRQPVGSTARIAGRIAIPQRLRAGHVGGQPQQGEAVVDHRRVGLARPVPFQHGKFRRMQPAAFPIAEDAGEFVFLVLAGRQQNLGREFRRSVQVESPLLQIRSSRLGLEGMQMGFIAGRSDQRPAFLFGEALAFEMGPERALYRAPLDQQGTAVGMGLRAPPGHLRSFDLAAIAPAKHPNKARKEKKTMVSVIASSVRKGNVLEKDGKLYLVITAENIHPGKGTPVTHLEMRRISDGVKTVERLRTTDSVEKAFGEHQTYQYLYQDGEQYVFMQPQTFDQLHVGSDVVGDAAPYLTENMDVQLQLFEGNAISIEIPQRATFEIVETEPVVKGQTASGSFKPALLSNGVKTMVPTHIVTGTRVVVMTEDGAYVERAKD